MNVEASLTHSQSAQSSQLACEYHGPWYLLVDVTSYLLLHSEQFVTQAIQQSIMGAWVAVETPYTSHTYTFFHGGCRWKLVLTNVN